MAVGGDDFSELEHLARSFEAAIPAVDPKVVAVVSKGALNIKTQLRKEAEGSTYFNRFGWTIAYDLSSGPGGVEAEIGPSSEQKSPGNIANIAYFGGANGGGASIPDPQGALNAESDRFMAALEQVVADL